MNLKEFEDKIKEFRNKLGDNITVCIADWSECYSPPYEVKADEIVAIIDDYIAENAHTKHGKILRIGNDKDE